jgi:hypothetical protein
MMSPEIIRGGRKPMITPTLKAACYACLLVIAAQAGAVTLAPTSGNAKPTVVTKTRSSAPLQGFITSVDLANNEIVINSQHFLLTPGLVALQDKRPGADGLLSVQTIKPGMYVSYRTETDGGKTRVVELWVQRGADKGKKP